MARHARWRCWSLPRVTVPLAGIALPPNGSESIALLSRMHSIEELAGGSQARAVAPTTYGNSASPLGSPDPALSFAFGWSAIGLETRGSEQAVTALLNATLWASAEELGVGGGGREPTIGGAARAGIHAVCGDDRLAMQMQAGGEFWTAQAVTAAPAQFPPGVFTGSSIESANPLSDPLLGPSGNRSNLPALGGAGAWCRPLPVPFGQSSPLASRAFWIPIGVLLVGFVVFWLSRGVKMPDLTRS